MRLADAPVIALDSPPVFGSYELLGELRGHGAASVYEARDRTGAIVALKRLERARSPADLQRFRREAELTRSLGGHPNIIPVLDIGEVDGVPYYTMPFAEGGTLVEWCGRRAPAPEVLADVMARVARAVGHAHVHASGPLLHRDLKPENILMDATGAPYVADFGIAKKLDAHETGTGDALVGTLDYMAPEQALGDSDKLTPAADIYSLGVVLYELITNDVPVRGASIAEFLMRLWSAEPIVPPRKLAPDVHRGLEDICLKCLENDPRRRYASAEDLARDLVCVRDGREPIIARPLPRVLRIARWIRRHPRAAYAAATAAAVLAVVGLAGSAVRRGWQSKQELVLDSNASIASGQAGAALFQLREYADHLVDIARHPTVGTILRSGDVRRNAPDLRPLLGGFDSCFVMTTSGRILAQWPAAAPYVYERSYAFRDYFQGARRLAETQTPGAYVARAFRSESRNEFAFAISTPVLDQRGTFVGIMVGTLSAKSAFGAVRMEETPQSGRVITALIGPRGNDRERGPDAPAPTDFAFLVHPGMDRGVEYPARVRAAAELRERFGLAAPPGRQLSLQYARALQLADYRDPIPGFEGEWLAALAPVGTTGLFVLVATRKEPFFNWLGASHQR
jgi:serine/threonine-protein kinase